MHIRPALTVIATSFVIAACAHRDPTSATPAVRNAGFGTLNGAKLELVAAGGIAGLQTRYGVDHDARVYAYSQRYVCSGTCGAARDTASGTLSAAAADSLFTLVWAQSPYSLRDDYGTTANAADMMGYTLTVTFEGNTKKISADDGTMPAAMRAIVDATRGIVAAARAR